MYKPIAGKQVQKEKFAYPAGQSRTRENFYQPNKITTPDGSWNVHHIAVHMKESRSLGLVGFWLLG